MKDLKNFVKTNWDGKSPLLLAYSGGPDSKALLYALLALNIHSLHVAHVDHGWRSESSLEAKKIQEEIEQLGLPFYTVRLNPPKEGNWEAVARQDRFLFFKKLHQKKSFQACLLAHQADDLAETTLKRVLEGAHLSFLGGMEKISLFDGMTLWRPLLGIRRTQIIEFLESQNKSAFMDPSNKDPLYLRARMRSDIFPFLREKFGKRVESNLLVLSRRGLELKEYLNKKISDRKVDKGPWGEKISFLGLEKIEARHLLQKLQPHLSRDFLEAILTSLLTRKPNCRFSHLLFVDRGILFVLSDSQPEFTDSFDLSLGKHTSGSWSVEVKLLEKPLPEPNWEDVWRGSFCLALPKGILALPQKGTHFKKLWNTKKVPAFLRFNFPLLFQNGKEKKEFLSGIKEPAIHPVFHVAFFAKDSF